MQTFIVRQKLAELASIWRILAKLTIVKNF